MASPTNFRPNVSKAVEVLAWLAEQQPGIDFYHVLKVLYFADKLHLRAHGRPILGDTYIKMEHGPAPSLVYDLLKKSDFLPPEVLKQISEAIGIERNGYRKIIPKRAPKLDLISGSDIECLQESLRKYGRMGFKELSRLTHQERAWREAPYNGEMDYTLMIDEDVPDRDELIARLKEDAAYMAF